MPSEKWYSLRYSASFFYRNDSECTTSTSFPVDSNILRVCLIGSDNRWVAGGVMDLGTLIKLESHAFLETLRLS